MKDDLNLAGVAFSINRRVRDRAMGHPVGEQPLNEPTEIGGRRRC